MFNLCRVVCLVCVSACLYLWPCPLFYFIFFNKFCFIGLDLPHSCIWFHLLTTPWLNGLLVRLQPSFGKKYVLACWGILIIMNDSTYEECRVTKTTSPINGLLLVRLVWLRLRAGSSLICFKLALVGWCSLQINWSCCSCHKRCWTEAEFPSALQWISEFEAWWTQTRQMSWKTVTVPVC